MARGIKFVKELGGIKEYKLVRNGLKILLLPKGIGEAIGFMVHYNVGSRNEGVGHTGSTHGLEHLLFRGSKNFPRDTRDIADIFASAGAYVNAGTSRDCTNYFEVCTFEHLAACMAVEADRMRGAAFTAEDWEGEKEIVRNEFEIDENSPASCLRKLVTATAISEHPYHHPVIGWRSDIEGVSVERIRQFYDTFYYPNNATVIVAGDFKEKEVLKMIVSNFGKIEPSAHIIPEVYTEEPLQQGERRVILKHPGGNGLVLLAWRAPAGSTSDFAALFVLHYILVYGRRSLLHQEFVTSGRAHEVYSIFSRTKNPSLFFLGIKLFTKDGHNEMERAVRDYLSNLMNGGISEEHILRAKRLAEAESLYTEDSLMGMLGRLSGAEGTGSWELALELLEDIMKVDQGILMRVFREYFSDDNLTTGWFVSQNPKGGGAE